jgi:glycosyltransferase involved in cell wall biosynthesis
MKVVHLNTYTRGGAAEAALRLHVALLQEGIDSKFLALYKGECDLKEVYDLRDELGPLNYWLTKIRNKLKTLSQYRISKRSGELFSTLDSVWKAEEHSLVRSSDVIHLHWISNYVDLPVFLKGSRRIVWTLHDHFLFSGGFHYTPPRQGFVTEQKLNEQKGKIKELLNERPIDIVLPSEHLKKLALSSGLLSECRFHVIKNPVDPKTFHPLSKADCRKQLNLPQDAKVLLFISEMIHYERKGFSILQKALSLLDNKLILVVAGKGDLPSQIGKVIVRHVGYVSDHGFLNTLYNSADLLVNPSLDDISSNTVIEAMACGLPAVTFNTGGIPELITDVNGLIASERTAGSLASAITMALTTAFDKNNIVSRSAREHSPALIAKQYQEVYLKRKI